MVKSYSVLGFILFISIASIGQGDYVLTIKNDTLKGKINFMQIGNVAQVSVKGVKKYNLSSIEVRSVVLKGKTYRPVQFSGKVQMMEVITDGYLSLMGFQPEGVMNYDGRLLLLRDGKKLEVPTLSFKKHVSNFLSADETLSAEIKEGNLDRKDLDQIIKRYNDFINNRTVSNQQQAVVEVKQKSKLETVDEIIEAVQKSELTTKEETVEMLNELKDKVVNQKSVPQYLGNALKENLKFDSDLVSKLELLLKD